MLSEINQPQKDKYYIIPLTGGIRESHTPRNRKWSGGCHGLGAGLGEGPGELLSNSSSVL